MFLLGAPEALNTIYVVTDLKAESEVKDPAGIFILLETCIGACKPTKMK